MSLGFRAPVGGCFSWNCVEWKFLEREKKTKREKKKKKIDPFCFVWVSVLALGYCLVWLFQSNVGFSFGVRVGVCVLGVQKVESATPWDLRERRSTPSRHGCGDSPQRWRLFSPSFPAWRLSSSSASSSTITTISLLLPRLSTPSEFPSSSISSWRRRLVLV